MDAHDLTALEHVSASKKLGEEEARELIHGASKIFVAKGKNVAQFNGGEATPEIVAALLGPTGNLRAPALRVGKTLLIGFDQATYEKVFA